VAVAQDCDIKAIDIDGADKLPDIKANFTCASAKLTAALSRIERLEAELRPFSVAKGIVAAFDRSEIEGACPVGWSPFKPAGGRFIVGAGVHTNTDANGPLKNHPSYKDKPTDAVGGEEKHLLAEHEIPTHAHQVYPHAGYTWPDIPAGEKTQQRQGATGGDTTTYVHTGTTSSWGGGQPHNTMPPYVALYYCIKD
jgi:hypothetical protein